MSNVHLEYTFGYDNNVESTKKKCRKNIADIIDIPAEKYAEVSIKLRFLDFSFIRSNIRIFALSPSSFLSFLDKATKLVTIIFNEFSLKNFPAVLKTLGKMKKQRNVKMIKFTNRIRKFTETKSEEKQFISLSARVFPCSVSVETSSSSFQMGHGHGITTNYHELKNDMVINLWIHSCVSNTKKVFVENSFVVAYNHFTFKILATMVERHRLGQKYYEFMLISTHTQYYTNKRRIVSEDDRVIKYYKKIIPRNPFAHQLRSYFS